MRQRISKNCTHIIGIDEVGRGPVAGPVTVGAVCVARKDIRRIPRHLADSKQLSEKKREEWLRYIKQATYISYTTTSISQDIIDSKGIMYALHRAISSALNRLQKNPEKTQLLLDGGLHAPKKFFYQKTIIKGDEKEPLIALASIAAKVTRDRKMVQLGVQYPEYGFETHKGYGTKKHYERIMQHGVCAIHRKSFLTVDGK